MLVKSSNFLTKKVNAVFLEIALQNFGNLCRLDRQILEISVSRKVMIFFFLKINATSRKILLMSKNFSCGETQRNKEENHFGNLRLYAKVAILGIFYPVVGFFPSPVGSYA